MECASTCLRIIGRYYGKTFSKEYIDKLCPASREGVSLLSVSLAAEQLGFRSLCGKFTLNKLSKASLPCILHWNQDHFVVLYRIRSNYRNRSLFCLSDSAKGLVKYGQNEFLEGWASTHSNGEDKGVVMLLEPGNSFHKMLTISFISCL